MAMEKRCSRSSRRVRSQVRGWRRSRQMTRSMNEFCCSSGAQVFSTTQVSGRGGEAVFERRGGGERMEDVSHGAEPDDQNAGANEPASRSRSPACRSKTCSMSRSVLAAWALPARIHSAGCNRSTSPGRVAVRRNHVVYHPQGGGEFGTRSEDVTGRGGSSTSANRAMPGASELFDSAHDGRLQDVEVAGDDAEAAASARRAAASSTARSEGQNLAAGVH